MMTTDLRIKRKQAKQSKIVQNKKDSHKGAQFSAFFFFKSENKVCNNYLDIK